MKREKVVGREGGKFSSFLLFQKGDTGSQSTKQKKQIKQKNYNKTKKNHNKNHNFIKEEDRIRAIIAVLWV